ncbi:Fc.00g036510.m01.CDS01 [Cosmosporella sp. VM-42]
MSKTRPKPRRCLEASQTTFCGFSHIPVDLLFMIFDLLPPVAAITLSLTCKSLFATFSQAGRLQNVLASSEDWTAFLLCLERDIPNHYLCFGCMKLRDFYPFHKLAWRGQKHRDCGREALRRLGPIRGIRPAMEVMVQLHSWRPEAGGPEVAFSEAHLVMNRHLYGDRHGLPIKTLEYSYSGENDARGVHLYFPPGYSPPSFPRPQDPTTPWKFIQNTTAKIINNELFLARLHRVSAPPMSAYLFEKFINSLGWPICHHLVCSAGFLAPDQPKTPWRKCIPQLHYQDPFRPRDSRRGFGGCSDCFTDYMVSMQGSNGKSNWTFELTTYHRLGSCRSIDDPVWRCLTDVSNYNCRKSYDPELGRWGKVRELCCKGEGQDAHEQAEWVRYIFTYNHMSTELRSKNPPR